VEFMAHMLQQDSPAVQAVACEGLAKLMLSGMLYDKSVSWSTTEDELR
jgi:condensin complex subunit 3